MSNKIKITFSGDIMSSSMQNYAVFHNGIYNYSLVFDSIRSYLQKSHYVIGNLETTIAGEDLVYTSEPASFNTPEPFLVSLKEAGFDFLSTANNHIMDRGEAGIHSTLNALEKNGLDHSGCYHTKDESERIFVKEINGLKIAILSFTYGTNSEYHGKFLPKDKEYMVNLLKRQAPYIQESKSLRSLMLFEIHSLLPQKIKSIGRSLLKSLYLNKKQECVIDNVSSDEIYNNENNHFLESAKKKICKAKSEADIVVVCLHCGGQYNNEIGDYTKFIFTELMAEPIDVIIGNHSHCVLPCIKEGPRFFCYSLGNFTFTPYDGWYIDGVLADYSILLNIYLDIDVKSIVEYSFSIVKNVRNDQGLTKPFLLYDLIKEEKDPIIRSSLEKDNEDVIKRFLKTTIKTIQKEYKL